MFIFEHFLCFCFVIYIIGIKRKEINPKYTYLNSTRTFYKLAQLLSIICIL